MVVNKAGTRGGNEAKTRARQITRRRGRLSVTRMNALQKLKAELEKVQSDLIKRASGSQLSFEEYGRLRAREKELTHLIAALEQRPPLGG